MQKIFRILIVIGAIVSHIHANILSTVTIIAPDPSNSALVGIEENIEHKKKQLQEKIHRKKTKIQELQKRILDKKDPMDEQQDPAWDTIWSNKIIRKQQRLKELEKDLRALENVDIVTGKSGQNAPQKITDKKECFCF